MEKKAELKPCPFCGHSDVQIRPIVLAGTWATAVDCPSCFAQVTGDIEAYAISNWNSRAYDPTVDGAVAYMKQVEWENKQLLLEDGRDQKDLQIRPSCGKARR
jgi:Lar family restriction alleviation protein